MARRSMSDVIIALHSYYAADRDGNGTWKMRSKPAAQRRAARLSFKSGTARMAVSSQLSSQSFISLIRFLRACSALSDAAQRAPPSIHHDGGSAEFCLIICRGTSTCCGGYALVTSAGLRPQDRVDEKAARGAHLQRSKLTPNDSHDAPARCARSGIYHRPQAKYTAVA